MHYFVGDSNLLCFFIDAPFGVNEDWTVPWLDDAAHVPGSSGSLLGRDASRDPLL